MIDFSRRVEFSRGCLVADSQLNSSEAAQVTRKFCTFKFLHVLEIGKCKALL